MLGAFAVTGAHLGLHLFVNFVDEGVFPFSQRRIPDVLIQEHGWAPIASNDLFSYGRWSPVHPLLSRRGSSNINSLAQMTGIEILVQKLILESKKVTRCLGRAALPLYNFEGDS